KFEYVVEVEPLEEELNTGNNRVSRRVKVTDQKTRVLLVQAYPNFEYRYLENLLTHGDHTIELRTVLQEADPDHAAQDDAALGGFPVRKDDLFSYDVIIFGDADPSLLSNAMLENIAEFVDSPAKGGGLVFIAGPRFNPLAYRGTPLEKLLPIDLTGAGYPEPGQPLTEGFVVRPTEAGLAIGPMQLGDTPRETRDIWPRLAPLYWMLEAPELKDGARVLAVHPRRLGHDGRPLAVICMQHVGAGKVLFHATDETWRWRRRVGDVFLARYWIQMIRFLSRPETSGPAPPVKLSALKPKYRHGETVRLRLKFFDPREAPADDNDVTVMLQHEGGQTQRLPMFRSPTSRGVFEGEVVDPPTGRCHAWLVTPDLGVRTAADDFVVEPPQGETEQIRTDVEALRRAATETKGRSYTMEDAEKIPGELPEGRRVAIETLDSIVLWNRWPVLLLFLGILIGEWLLRKRRFMV
ncbi:MAG: hypothetical protein HQ581_07865, partial [Planctomycetes bacterium]|nr:hypothetical protein [Planctomycetota bacterium]